MRVYDTREILLYRFDVNVKGKVIFKSEDGWRPLIYDKFRYFIHSFIETVK